MRASAFPPPAKASVWLAVRGNPARLARFVEAVTGRRLPPSTISRWMNGHRRPDACTEALLAVIADPAKLEMLER